MCVFLGVMIMVEHPKQEEGVNKDRKEEGAGEAAGRERGRGKKEDRKNGLLCTIKSASLGEF
jgi:hypothetical protein